MTIPSKQEITHVREQLSSLVSYLRGLREKTTSSERVIFEVALREIEDLENTIEGALDYYVDAIQEHLDDPRKLERTYKELGFPNPRDVVEDLRRRLEGGLGPPPFFPG